MKKSILLLSFFLNLSIYSQKESGNLKIEINNLNKEQIINLLEEKTDYHFFYINSWLDNRRISKNFNNTSITNILDYILNDTAINYYITNDKKIILTYGNLISNSIYDNFDIDDSLSFVKKRKYLFL
ncbi:hypothetical protein PG913_07850 [Tenacibaculum pacificus]|uniref:hypothetical protein n=1 Tax=Tenacibaculum pacificus TaxID=3018314 RepID=UPI0022F38A1E|nr:hypothetical protein [Tenacibaculum pacificus]WBX72819.1 hypothetical protein PG913_07850 [Tenacibaculum pacificus]